MNVHTEVFSGLTRRGSAAHAEVCRRGALRLIEERDARMLAEGFLSRRAAEERSGLSSDTLRRPCTQDRLTTRKVQAAVYYLASDIDRLAAEVRAAGGPLRWGNARAVQTKRAQRGEIATPAATPKIATREVSPGQAVRRSPDKRKATPKPAWGEPMERQVRAEMSALYYDRQAREAYFEVLAFECGLKYLTAPVTLSVLLGRKGSLS